MALINCPECELKASNRAKKCPKCGYPFENIKEVKPIYIEQVTPNIAKPKGCKFSTVIVAIFLVLLLGIYAYNQYIEYQIKEDNPTSEKNWKPWTNAQLNKKKTVKTTFTDDEAAYAAQQFVERQLKVPASADFDALFKSKITRSGKEYTIISHVESENGFGAKVRSRYVVVIKRNSSGEVSLLDLVIE